MCGRQTYPGYRKGVKIHVVGELGQVWAQPGAAEAGDPWAVAWGNTGTVANEVARVRRGECRAEARGGGGWG